MYVAPETMSICALCAVTVSSTSCGSAYELISWSRPLPLGYCGTSTFVMTPLETVIETCSGPYGVSAVCPRNVPSLSPVTDPPDDWFDDPPDDWFDDPPDDGVDDGGGAADAVGAAEGVAPLPPVLRPAVPAVGVLLLPMAIGDATVWSRDVR